MEEDCVLNIMLFVALATQSLLNILFSVSELSTKYESGRERYARVFDIPGRPSQSLQLIYLKVKFCQTKLFKIDSVAVLISDPPPDNSTTMHIRLDRQDIHFWIIAQSSKITDSFEVIMQFVHPSVFINS